MEILSAGMLNPGKYLILISGTVASVEMALDAGVAAGEDSLVDHILIPYLNSQVLPALETSREPERWDALGILETLSAVCAIEGADRAVKAAGVTLLSISTGNELGGKRFSEFPVRWERSRRPWRRRWNWPGGRGSSCGM